ncbi:hypothetical protein EJ05DRAFT_515306 [Pseudovirgaria hyperparasitica]|uniref:Rhodopsin domain-containing protein n=1 Tax=Pseudovirgaria hyperparasitica TaxID=470096 RepID=A0A6A6VQF9_9PEZI|nr:uncharacterized protein EJ05DRAFT_515306 [Pseudovirgaria hyperparasitica]KAF2752842.1 hypothetical protein EJ05DRAFT_515306 [Pseudovirgaria hyperparasitica]
MFSSNIIFRRQTLPPGMLEGPALAPPPGVVPNFVNPPDLTEVFVGTTIVCIVIATFLVFARIYTKLAIIRRATWDDWILLLGWSTFILMNAFSCAFAFHGAGRHQWNVQLKNMILIGKYFQYAAGTYSATLALVKLSICVQLRTIFAPTKKSDFMWWSTWSFGIFVLLYYLVNVFVVIFQCNPREKAWEPFLRGECADQNAIYLTCAIFNIVSDIVIILIPQYAIWKLRMPWQKRLQIALIFMTAAFVCGCSAVRIYYTVQLNISPDISRVGLKFGLWAVAEVTATMICACLPTFPRFFQATIMKTSFFTSLKSRTYAYGKGSKFSSSTVSGNGALSYRRMDEAERKLRSPSEHEDVELGPCRPDDGIIKQTEISMTADLAQPAEPVKYWN